MHVGDEPGMSQSLDSSPTVNVFQSVIEDRDRPTSSLMLVFGFVF